MVERFYERVLKDEELAAFFEGTAMDGLRRMLTMFVCAALDGPIEYSGRPLGHAHQGKGIKIHHFQRFVELMMEEVGALKLSEKDEYEVLGRIAMYADVITGGLVDQVVELRHVGESSFSGFVEPGDIARRGKAEPGVVAAGGGGPVDRKVD